MSILKRITKSIYLDQAAVLINNTLDIPEILTLMTGYGYGVPRMLEGRNLLVQAAAVVKARSAAAGAQLDATRQTRKAEQAARDAYQSLAKVVRAVFVRDRAQRVTLGIDGPAPKTIPAFLAAAYTLFDNIAGNEAIKATLAGYGYDDLRLQHERAKIAVYDALHQANEAAKGSAQQATQEQDALVAELADWLAQFIKIARVALRGKPQLLEKLGILARSSKTPAQRAAPLKATATRKARKAVPPVAVPPVIAPPVLVPQPVAPQAAQTVPAKEGNKAA